jgi:hypothetical protein
MTDIDDLMRMQLAASGRVLSIEQVREWMGIPRITGDAYGFVYGIPQSLPTPRQVPMSKFNWTHQYRNIPMGGAWDGWLWYEVGDLVYRSETGKNIMILRAGCRLDGSFYEHSTEVDRSPVEMGLMDEDELIEHTLPGMLQWWEDAYKDTILGNPQIHMKFPPQSLDTIGSRW